MVSKPSSEKSGIATKIEIEKVSYGHLMLLAVLVEIKLAARVGFGVLDCKLIYNHGSLRVTQSPKCSIRKLALNRSCTELFP